MLFVVAADATGLPFNLIIGKWFAQFSAIMDVLPKWIDMVSTLLYFRSAKAS